MRILFATVCGFSALATLAACGSPKVDIAKYEAPAPTTPDLEKMIASMTCSKKETEQTFSAEALAKRISIEDQIENKDIESIDCDGKVVNKSHGPVRSMTKILDIEAPKGLNEKVSFVEVENQRSCVVTRASAIEDAQLQTEIELPDGKKIKVPSINTEAGQSGMVKLALTDLRIKLFNQTNLIEGSNAVQIRYMGKCIEYRKDRDATLGEAHNCIKAEVLAVKDMIIDLKISRPEAAGVHRIDRCNKK